MKSKMWRKKKEGRKERGREPFISFINLNVNGILFIARDTRKTVGSDMLGAADSQQCGRHYWIKTHMQWLHLGFNSFARPQNT